MQNRDLVDKLKSSYNTKKYDTQKFSLIIKTYNPQQYNNNKRKMKRC